MRDDGRPELGDDGRLELGENGLPVDSCSKDVIRDDVPERTSRTARLIDSALTGGDGVSTTARRWVAAGLVVALAAAVAVSTRSALPAPSASDVHGVSARVVPRLDSAAAPRILAAYAVSARPGSAAPRIVGVAGAGVAHAVETTSGAGTQSFLVEPDCARVLARIQGSAYELVLSPSGDRSSTTTVSGFDGADALVAAAARACWGSTVSRALRPESVSARPGRGAWTELDVVLRNGTGFPLSVTAVDVANVDTLSMADSRVLEPASARTVRVRLPIARCAGSATSAPPSLTWSVGPPDGVPTAFAVTPLTAGQRTGIARAAQIRCGAPPAVSVSVLGATVARDAPSIDDQGVSVGLRLRVTSGATGPLTLGDGTSGLTADARPAFTAATLPPGRTAREALVVWHTRCGSASADDPLPASSVVDGLTYVWTVPLQGASLRSLRDAACR